VTANNVITGALEIPIARVGSGHASIVQRSPVWPAPSIGSTVAVELALVVVPFVRLPCVRRHRVRYRTAEVTDRVQIQLIFYRLVS